MGRRIFFPHSITFWFAFQPIPFQPFFILVGLDCKFSDRVLIYLYYLDDFWCGDSITACTRVFDVLQDVCHQLEVPLSPDKVEAPSRVITFLGIQLDAHSQTLSLPQDKLQALQEELSEWNHHANKKKCTKQELLSLIGKLSFASKYIPAGRTFFRRLIDLQ